MLFNDTSVKILTFDGAINTKRLIKSLFHFILCGAARSNVLNDIFKRSYYRHQTFICCLSVSFLRVLISRVRIVPSGEPWKVDYFLAHHNHIHDASLSECTRVLSTDSYWYVCITAQHSMESSPKDSWTKFSSTTYCRREFDALDKIVKSHNSRIQWFELSVNHFLVEIKYRVQLWIAPMISPNGGFLITFLHLFIRFGDTKVNQKSANLFHFKIPMNQCKNW